MKSINNFIKKTFNSTKNSNEIGIIQTPDKSAPRFFYLFFIIISNFSVFILMTPSSEPKSPSIPLREDYSEVILSLELKTPFEEGKKISLKNSLNQIFKEVYFIEKIETETNMNFENQETFVVYVSNNDLYPITQSKQMIALPPNAMIPTSTPTLAKRTHYEINY